MLFSLALLIVFCQYSCPRLVQVAQVTLKEGVTFEEQLKDGVADDKARRVHKDRV